ncbi:flagellar protein FlaG [Pseudomonadales bacterium]|nr:flagellar protein FlaG [Pseudomonadales bacterium]MDC1308067.1 flagellar protein FlaG [Pseudomonadales bacterium]
MSNTIPMNNTGNAAAAPQRVSVAVSEPAGQGANKVKAEPAAALDVIKTSVHDVSNDAQTVREGGAELNQRMLDQLEEAARRLQQAVETTPTRLKFSVDEVASRFVISVTDDETGEVIRQVPGEAILRIAHSIEMMKGVLFDKSL